MPLKNLCEICKKRGETRVLRQSRKPLFLLYEFKFHKNFLWYSMKNMDISCQTYFSNSIYGFRVSYMDLDFIWNFNFHINMDLKTIWNLLWYSMNVMDISCKNCFKIPYMDLDFIWKFVFHTNMDFDSIWNLFLWYSV